MFAVYLPYMPGGRFAVLPLYMLYVMSSVVVLYMLVIPPRMSPGLASG